MKSFTKLAFVVLALGGVLFVIGHAQGGRVYSTWHNGQLYAWADVRNIGFTSELAEDVQDLIEDVQDELQDTVEDIGLAKRHHFQHGRHCMR